MDVKQAVNLATTTLAHISDTHNLDARLLTCHACDIEQTQLITQPDKILTSRQAETLHSILHRRSNGEPLAYITGTKEFWSLDFAVNKHVLIPRPETELLVELAIKTASNLTTPKIVDLGTGSGAIAISLAIELQDMNANIFATDISQLALDVAKQNAATHKVDINFIQSNWYQQLADEKFNLIVCNPPYISENDPNLEPQVKKHEPNNALISNFYGMHDLTQVISAATQHLLPNGKLLIEHGFLQHEKVKSLFNKYDFSAVTLHKDLAGLERATSGKRS